MKDRNEKPQYFSPLNLICTAYIEEKPIIDKEMTGIYQILEEYLAPLSEKDQNAVRQIIHSICIEKENKAFREGILTGFNLAQELTEEHFSNKR